MLVLQTIRWKNFLSTGNAFTEIPLNEESTTLIIGENGSGKSTIMDALTFVLYGKPFRKINKPGLVNKINNKNCVVEIEFYIHNKEYKVIRGIKPNIFEIWCDGVFINQDSASRDYQDYLEKFILRMNYKTFTQVVILGSAAFVPFMQLTPADRRQVIENLLDIQVFSTMNMIIKQKYQVNREELEKNKIESLGKVNNKDYMEKNLESLRKNTESQMEKLKKESDEYQEAINTLLDDTNLFEHKQDSVLKTYKELLDKDFVKTKNEYVKVQVKIESNLNRLIKDMNIFHQDNCPTCKQSIATNHKEIALEEANLKKIEYESALESIAKKLEHLDNMIAEQNDVNARLVKFNNVISSNKSEIRSLERMVAAIKDNLQSFKNSDILIEDNEKQLENIKEEILSLEKRKQELLDERQLIDTATMLLKDGGIKTKIIKQYLPIINQKINKYLMKMGFFCSFNLNENFEEVIQSRYMDEFSYHNFSEGEKARIDLAILFAWREVARKRNSANCNLLIFDEIFDSSLDAKGTDDFMTIMLSLTSGENVIVISHKTDQIIDKFRKTYKVTKVQNFSRVAEH